MPIYEYSCTDCGHKLEIMQKINESPLENCPACGQNTLKKLVSAAAFHLKGTGWSAKRDNPEEKSAPPPSACGAGACCACAEAAS